MPDWYKTHNLSPEAYPDSEYTDWAQDQGLYVDAAGNVDYGPPDTPASWVIRGPNEQCKCCGCSKWMCGCSCCCGAN